MGRSIDEIYRELGDKIRADEFADVASVVDEFNAIGDDVSRAMALYTRCVHMLARQEAVSAAPLLKEALDLLETNQNTTYIPAVRNLIGRTHMILGDYAKSIEVFSQSLEEARQLGDRKIEGAVLSNLATIYGVQGDFPRSIPLLKEGYAIHNEIGHDLNMCNTAMNIAAMYHLLGDYEEMKQWMERTIERATAAGLDLMLSQTYSHLGYSLLLQGELETALDHTKRGYEIKSKLMKEPLLCNELFNYCMSLTATGSVDKAKQLMSGASKHDGDRAENRAFEGIVRGAIAEADGELATAKEYYVKSYEILKGIQDQGNTLETIVRLRDLAKKSGDFEGYITYNEEYQKLNDEIRGANAARRMALQEHESELKIQQQEREKERAVLYSALPKNVADRMIRGEDVTDHIDDASVMFLDIVGFTTLSDKIPAGHVIHLLKAIFKVCDTSCARHDVAKVKTIGDSYMAVSTSGEDHARKMANAAVEIVAKLKDLTLTMPPELGDTSWTQHVDEITVRIGLHSGPIVAGVVGDDRLQYDVWGDTVNVASRMESSGEAGRIHVSEAFALTLRIDDDAAFLPGNDDAGEGFHVTKRGALDIKGKGTMTTFWLEGA